jgi:hypothetical protein
VDKVANSVFMSCFRRVIMLGILQGVIPIDGGSTHSGPWGDAAVSKKSFSSPSNRSRKPLPTRFIPDLAFWFLGSAKMHFQEFKKHLHIGAAKFVPWK